jgi:hypothetical protein
MRIVIALLILLSFSLSGPNKESLASESGPPQNPEQSQKGWDEYFRIIGEYKLDLSLRGFEIRPLWIQANANFKVSFEFYIGEDSYPTNIQLISGDRELSDVAAAKKCLAAWTLSGFQLKKKYLMEVIWRHIKGYTTLTLVGDQMNLLIRLETSI